MSWRDLLFPQEDRARQSMREDQFSGLRRRILAASMPVVRVGLRHWKVKLSLKRFADLVAGMAVGVPDMVQTIGSEFPYVGHIELVHLRDKVTE